MTPATSISPDAQPEMQIIPLHFDVVESYLPLEEFIIAANSAQAILQNFNSHFFDGKIKYQIIVLPPEAGSFKERLGLRITATGVAIFLAGAVSGEAISGTIKGLTGKSIFDIFEMAGETIKDVAELTHTKISTNLSAIFLAEATKAFLQKETAQLEECGITKDEFREAYQQRNELYEACYKNTDIKGIGFSETEHFPIKRKDFPRFITELPEKTEEDKNEDWRVEITYIKVTSPNWERGDNRTWKAKYGENKEAYFSIDDNSFWEMVEAGNLTWKGKDSLKVQWAYLLDGSKRKKCRVLKVLEYNGTSLGHPLTDEELDILLGRHTETLNEQPDLFSELKR